MAASALRELGLLSRCTLHINTLGTADERSAYKVLLTSFLRARKSLLSADSQRRLESGHVLRVLDSKEERDQLVIAGRGHELFVEGAGSSFGGNACTCTGEADEEKKEGANGMNKKDGAKQEELSTKEQGRTHQTQAREKAPLLWDSLGAQSRDRFNTVSRKRE